MASNNSINMSEKDSDGIRVYEAHSILDDGIRVFAVSDRSSRYSSSSESLIDERFSMCKTYDFDQLHDLVSFLNSNNLLRSTVGHKKNIRRIQVANYNSNIDLYTQKTIDPHDTKYEVDHIFEIQCFVFVIAAALHTFDGDKNGRETFNKLREKLSNVINSNVNLNITDRNTNLVKMNVFKVFIKMRWVYRDRGLADFLRNSNFDKPIERYCSCLKRVCLSIRDQLVLHKKNSESSETLKIKYAWEKIIEEFDNFYHSLKI